MKQFTNQMISSEPAHAPVAVEIANFAQNLADRAHVLAERVNAKLHPVMTSDMPRVCETDTEKYAEYPPLFSDLRNSFQGIASALDIIEYAMLRTEL